MSRHLIGCAIVLTVLLTLSTYPAWAQLQKGAIAPSFVAVDINNKEVNLDKIMKDKPDLVILFFFTTATGQDIAVKLRRLDLLYGKDKIKIAAIGWKEEEAALKKFASDLGIQYYLIKDSPELGAEQKYGPFKELPLTFIVTDQKRVLKTIKGSGKTEADVITEVAIAFLQQRKMEQGQVLTKEAEKAGENAKTAKEVNGYALTLQGKLDEAQVEFGAIGSKDGLAKVALEKGDTAKAIEIANQAPDSGYAQTVKGTAQMREGKIDEAKATLDAAAQKPAQDWQKSETVNTSARIEQGKGKTDEAITKYQQAVALGPYNVVALSNEGAAYREKGDLKKATEVLESAQGIRNDGLVTVMLQQIQREMKEANDVKRGELIRNQINDLRQRFEALKAAGKEKPFDSWTTQPLVIGLLPSPGNANVMLERAGADVAIVREIQAQLQANGNVQVVEREVLDKLLQELNLGSSELANPNTQLQLGRVLSARMLGFIDFAKVGVEPNIILRLVDTETTSLAGQVRKPIKDLSNIDPLVAEITKEITGKLSEGRILRGLIADVEKPDAILINIGKKHGVKVGQQFVAVKPGPPIEVGGKTLGNRETRIGAIEVTAVEDEISTCKTVGLSEGAKLEKEMRVKFLK